jgi:RNA polymerase sigma factor (sigma-70 family)
VPGLAVPGNGGRNVSGVLNMPRQVRTKLARGLEQVREETLHPVSKSVNEGGRDDLDDAALVELVCKSDHEALAVLYKRHGATCYRVARRITANDALAEDAVQEVFTGLWRAPAAYLPGQGSVRAWLLGLSHHKAVDFVRRETAQQRRQNAEAAERALDPPSVDPADEAWAGIRAEEVRSALAELPEPQRHALALAYFGGYTQREIANLTGVPLGTVKTRMFAAMRRLHVRLSDHGDLAGEGSS